MAFWLPTVPFGSLAGAKERAVRGQLQMHHAPETHHGPRPSEGKKEKGRKENKNEQIRKTAKREKKRKGEKKKKVGVTYYQMYFS